MTNAGARRDDAEVVECGLSPLKETIALAVALVLHLDVAGKRLRSPELVNDDRVVAHEVDRYQRVYFTRVAAQYVHRVAHGCQIHHGGNAGEILHQDTGGAERNLARASPVSDPVGQGASVIGRDAAAILKT